MSILKFHRNELRALLCGIILVYMITLTGCQQASESSVGTKTETNNVFPLTIVDDGGRRIELAAEPHRIVSLAPSNTEILFFLGLNDRIVGVTSYCDYPAQAETIAKIGDFENPSLEKIVSLKPDLVLATEMHQLLIEAMEDVGLKVMVLSPKSLEEIFDGIKMVGMAAGIPDKALELTLELQARVDAVREKVASIPVGERPSVYYEIWSEPFMSAGGNTLSAQLIDAAGGINITDDYEQDYPEISEEVIIKENPAVMVNSYGHSSAVITDEEIMARNGWSELAFVKNGRIYTIDADLVTIPGPRIVEGLEIMVGFFYPEL